MNKIIYSLLIIFAMTIQINVLKAYQTAELRVGGFYHTSHKFRNVYEHVGPSYQIEFSSSLPYSTELWTNVDYYFKNANINLDYQSKIRQTTVSSGWKYLYPLGNNYSAYFGAGMSYGRISLYNESCCGTQRISKLAFGGVIKSGIKTFITPTIYANIFLDYFYQPIYIDRYLNAGGLKFGVGIGSNF